MTTPKIDDPMTPPPPPSPPARQRFAPRIAVARVAMALVMLATFGAGIGAERYGISASNDAGANSALVDLPAFQTLQETWDRIHSDYVDVDAIDDEALIYGAAAGMVDALGDDGHSTFLSPDEAKAWRQSSRGQLIGIGIQVDFSDGRPIVLAPVEGSPAAEAGIRSEDIILSVNGQTTENMSQTTLFQQLRGEEGTTVELTLERPSEDRQFSVTLERRKITVAPVSWTMLPGNVAFIRIVQFIVGTTDGVEAAVNEAKAQGAVAIVLDLRDNPGGLVFEAVGVASQFLPEGQAIYQYQDREGGPRPINSVGIGVATDLPMVVLIDNGSASAAEIVASALQENGRAETIGETTYGTGTVLTPMELEDGSMVVLGTALWLTASGEQMWHVGVAPTIEVEMPDGVEQFRPDTVGDVTAADLQSSDDVQLARAYTEIMRLTSS